MKRKILVPLMISLLMSSLTKAQNTTCWKNINTISTHWDDNSESFDWTAAQYAGYLKGDSEPDVISGNNVIPSPFLHTGPTGNQPNVEDLRDLHITDPNGNVISTADNLPEDGWELLLKDFGTLDPDGDISYAYATQHPLFILYNRYTAKVRIFFLFRPTDNTVTSGSIGAEMALEFKDYNVRNATLSNTHSIATATESFRIINGTSTANQFGASNEAYTWFYSEFQLNYDPCACTRDDKWAIRIKLISQADVELKINGTITESGLTDASGNLKKNDRYNPSVSLFDNGQKLYNKGQKAYKEWEGYGKQVNDFLGDQDEELVKQARKNIVEWYKTAVDEINSGSHSFTLTQANIISSNYAQIIQGNEETFDIDDVIGEDFGTPNNIGQVELFDFIKTDFKSIGKLATQIKPVANALPYVGTVIALADFFTAAALTGTLKQLICGI